MHSCDWEPVFLPTGSQSWCLNLFRTGIGWAWGLVTKRRDRPYHGGRSPHWVKVKNPKSSAMMRAKDIDRSRCARMRSHRGDET